MYLGRAHPISHLLVSLPFYVERPPILSHQQPPFRPILRNRLCLTKFQRFPKPFLTLFLQPSKGILEEIGVLYYKALAHQTNLCPAILRRVQDFPYRERTTTNQVEPVRIFIIIPGNLYSARTD